MKYENIAVKKLDTSEVEITGSIPVATLTEYRKKALTDIGNSVEIAGFRKGHIPEKILVDRVGEVYIVEESAEFALKDIAPEIIEKEAPTYVGRPQIAITKLAPGSAVEFKITVGVMPEIKLPDYKKIAQKALSAKEAPVEVTDKDVEDLIDQVRKERAHHAFHLAHKDHDGHNHSEDALKEFMPEITDDFVKTLGSYTDVADFKTKTRANILKDKENKALERRRAGILEALLAETTLVLPPALIDNEINRMFAQFEGDVQGIGLSVEDYLKHIKKTPEDLIKEWRPDAEKRAKVNVILGEIAKQEKITADKEAIAKQVEFLTTTYKDIDSLRAHAYVEHNLIMENVIKLLEEQK